MLFKKFFFFTIMFSIILFLNFQNFYSYYSININYFFLKELENLKFGFILDFYTLTFINMVLIVTSLVTLYSEYYMEHYNNKKFFLLMLMFFVSMIFLVLSKSYLNLMMGWDFLGLTSICLIMFYPNKITLNNSILTMFFNRLGDVIMIFIVSFFFFKYSSFYLFMQSNESFLLLLLLFCGFTKSAQFPLSSWLPAAMSAPTPISAMVHSSTLVTAGIFLMHKLMMYLFMSSIAEIFCVFSILTFLIGGLLALLELDYKKIVAFSTMSQISMIMIFCSLNLINMALTHMLYHALFKTLMFCCCGMFFISNFSDQIFNQMKSISKITNKLFFLGIYSMSGLFFCSSFFSKDLVLEYMCEFSEFWFLLFILGSIFTLFYSTKLMNSCYSWINNFKIINLKSSNIFILFMFSILTVYSNKIFGFLLFVGMSPCIDLSDIFLISMFMLSFMIINMNKMVIKNFFIHLTMEIAFMKFFSYSMFKNNLNFLKNMTLNDEMFFKPIYLNFNKMKITNNKIEIKSNFFLLYIFFLFLLI